MSPSEVAELLDYCPTTGVFAWKARDRALFSREKDWKHWNRRYAGSVAGNVKPDGYCQIKIFGRSFRSHRLAWAISHGVWPENIDHINGDRGDNRLANLRSVTHAQNMKNRTKHHNNTTGLTGVSVHKATGKFVAQISVDGKRRHLGLFARMEDAHAAWVEAKTRAGCSERHGISERSEAAL